MQKPLTVLTLAYAAGLLLGYGFLYFPAAGIILVIVSLVISGIFALFGRVSLQRFLLVAIPGLAGMAAYLYSAAWLPSDHYTHLFPETKAPHQMSGTIASSLDRDPDRTSFVVDVHRIDAVRASGRVRVSIREANASIGYGDGILFSGKLFRPGGFRNPGAFDYSEYLEQSGVHRTVSLKGLDQIQVVVPGAGVFRTIQDWRERIRRAFLASTTGPGSAILQAMVLGEEGGLTDEVRDWFMAAGATHIISISGSHLGMFSIICFGLIRLLLRLMPERWYHRLTLHADPRKIAAWATLPLVIFYTLLAGGQTATVRSLVMIAAALAALILDRETALVHSLAIAALLILAVTPQALFDISFQLSFLSVLSIAFVVRLWQELGRERKGRVIGLLRDAALLMIISFSTSLVTSPLVARYFNQVSLAGLVSNTIVVPFAGMVIVPLGLLSGVLSLFMDALPFAGLNQFMADRFISTVVFFSRLPFAVFHPRSPGLLWLTAYAVLVASCFVLLRAWLLARFKPLASSFRISRTAVAAATGAALLLVALSVPAFLPKRGLEVSFPDVGQGDSALVQIPGGRTILIDGGGTYDDRFDVGRRVLAPFLWGRGVRRLDLVVLSHPHPDHMNGLKFILKAFDVGEVWTHGMDGDLPGYDDLVRVMRDKRVRHTVMSARDATVRLGDAQLKVLHPGPTFYSRERKGYAAENDRSLVLRIAFRDRVLLFTGDIGTGAEGALLRGERDLKCDLLKVPHHGSRSSSSEAFVAAARPSFAVVTVGRENRYHHPAEEVIERYQRTGSRIYRTDRDGAVFIQGDDRGLHATAWDDRELTRVREIGATSLQLERENWKRVWIRKWEL